MVVCSVSEDYTKVTILVPKKFCLFQSYSVKLVSADVRYKHWHFLERCWSKVRLGVFGLLVCFVVPENRRDRLNTKRWDGFWIINCDQRFVKIERFVKNSCHEVLFRDIRLVSVYSRLNQLLRDDRLKAFDKKAKEGDIMLVVKQRQEERLSSTTTKTNVGSIRRTFFSMSAQRERSPSVSVLFNFIPTSSNRLF